MHYDPTGCEGGESECDGGGGGWCVMVEGEYGECDSEGGG